MPLVGYVDPSKPIRNRMGQVGYLPPWLTPDELLVKAMDPRPEWSSWSYELVNAVVGSHQERRERISSSALTGGCPRGQILERKVDYVDDIENNYLSVRGTMVHRTMEVSVRPGAIAEAWFGTTIDDIHVSCSPDFLSQELLVDYKVTDSPPRGFYPYVHHKEQVMLNAYIARHAERWRTYHGGEMVENGPLPFDPREHPVKKVALVYLGPKGPETYVIQKSQEFVTPAGKTKKASRPVVWDDQEVLDTFRPRIHLFRNALDSYPDWPEPYVDPDTGKVYHAEEVWGGKPGWKCPGPPLCRLDCLAKRDSEYYMWPKDGSEGEEDG